MSEEPDFQDSEERLDRLKELEQSMNQRLERMEGISAHE